MSRSWQLFVLDMQEACERVLRYTDGMSAEEFARDQLIRDAVLRNLFIIGEAAKKIPQQVRIRHPEVEWKAMAGLRDVLAHAYFALDDATLWDIIDNEVPELLRHVRIILQES